MKKTINGYEIVSGTAVAASIDELARQRALFIHRIEDEFGNGDCIIYDCDMPEDEEDLWLAFENFCPSTYAEDLGSFIPDVKEDMDGYTLPVEAYLDYLKEKGVTRTWRVYGFDGHRQRESFHNSFVLNCSDGESIRIIEINNADVTGTNEYSEICITRNTTEECEEELEGQLSDGVFENSKIGRVVEIES